MIAKQSKASPISNKIQEKSIKNTTAASFADAASVNASANKQQEDPSKLKDTQPEHQFPRITHKKLNQPNETRSEINQIERSLPVATSTPDPPSGPSSSPPPPLSSPSQAPMALQAASSTTMSAGPTSLLNASTKIQQRQQKFLAAAAKSATSPQTYHLQQHQQQAVAWQSNSSSLAESRSVTESTNTSACTNTCCSATLIPQCCRHHVPQSNVRSILAVNQQFHSVRCCPLDKIPVPATDKNVASSDHTGDCAKHQAQQRAESPGPVYESDVPAASSASISRTKTMRVADGGVCDKASDRALSCNMSNRQPPPEHEQPQAQIATTNSNACGPIDCASANAKIARSAAAALTVPVDGGVYESSHVVAINSADICRKAVAEQRPIAAGNENGCEYRHCPQKLSHHHNHQHHLKHQQQQPGNQSAEVRRLYENTEFMDEKDKININHQKNTFKHNQQQQQHFHHSHNNQQAFPQLQYQPAQQILTANTLQNQSKSTSLAAHPPQQVMAHYKFHNDCQSSVLTYEQVKRLDFVMDQVVPVHGRGNAPTLYVKLKELIRSVKHKLHEHSIEIRDVRLNGGASNFVLAPENSHYNDLDLILGTDLSNEDRFDVIRDVVLECLMEFYPKEESQEAEVRVEKNQDQNNRGGHLFETSLVADSQAAEQEVNLISEDLHTEEASSRSDRSSSFQSDNLNITNNDLDDASDHSDSDEDEEDNIVVTIDSDEDIRAKMMTGSGPEVTNNKTLERPLEGNNCELKETTETIKEARDSSKEDQQLNAAQYQHLQMPLNKCAIKEAYVHKMVKVNDDDRWSLISLGVQPSEMSNYNHMQQQNNQLSESTQNMPLCCAQAQSANSSSSHKIQQSIGACQQSQLPNSIELKFVDRMRRKFEFSVDSFQIILDSLIQFYDYAPQSTITIQRRLSSSHPISSLLDPMIGRRASCSQCCEIRMLHQKALNRDAGEKNIDKFLDDRSDSLLEKKQSKKNKSSNKDASLNGSRSYYDLPLEPSNSLSNSSVASSSGCSSSSSVVSSSSSSLSCDEDHEDLDCDVDNSPSSSASTSSLLSSTTVSLSILSGTDSLCDPGAQLGSIDSASSPPETSMIADNHDQKGAQKSTNGKQIQEHTSKNDCIGSSKIAETECDFETSKLSSCAVISENFYPTVIGRSEYGNFKEALYHLEKKLIATRSPEEIRGGGLLKYCNLLVKNYKPTNVLQIRTLERYMCSRFFIDFSDLNQQRAKLESYLANHFSDDPMQKYHYLTILHNVVQRSTVCLMNHELRLTLNMIRELAYELNEQQQQHQQQQQQKQQQQQQQQQQQSQSQHQSKAAQGRSALCGQSPLLSQPQSRQQVDQREAQYQQQAKPTVMQSGVYRVKLVNYALAKPVRS